ncbi:MAG: nucleoside recognition domain-containing protein, partial [Planctomycetota bacterium]
FQPVLEEALAGLAPLLENPMIPARALGILLLSQDKGAEAWVAKHLGENVRIQAKEKVAETQKRFSTSLKLLFANAFYAQSDRIVDRVTTSEAGSPSLLVRFGRVAQRPLAGTLIAVCVMIAAYYWVGVFGATLVVDALGRYVFDGFLVPLCDKMVAPIPSEFLRDAIMDPDFGLLPSGLFLAVGLVLPVLFCFYLLQAVLEDSGYLPRLAVLFDRLFRWLGLNGQSLIPLILGFSCVTMAVITTRMLPSRKERIILTLLLILGIPCAPLLAVMLVILHKMPWTAGATVFGVIGLQILVAGYVASKLIPGKLPDLILEIPKMRIPRPGIVLSKTWRRTWSFMREALPVFLLASFVVFLFNRMGGLSLMETLFRPFMQGFLGLPDESVQVFIKTAIRRESGAAELSLLSSQFSNLQLVVALLVMTFLMPCINAAIVIIKERGLKVALSILFLVAVWAVVAGSLVNAVCRGLGITFT